jgi:hypothetical protein
MTHHGRPWVYRGLMAVGGLAGLLLVALASWIAIHGRFDLTTGSRHIAIRRVTPVSLIAWLVFMGLAAALGPARRQQVLEHVSALFRAHTPLLAAILSVAVCAAGIRQGAFTAAGADPYGYVSQSLLWAHGNPVQHLPAVALDAPVNAFAFCPLGYRPGVVSGTMVPTLASGFPMQMALLVKAGGARAGYLAVPLLAGLTVWLTYVIGRRFISPGPALLAAACAACSPVFVFHMLEPMSDVPVTAWWLAAVALALGGTDRSAIGAGLAASIAVLTRPNIVPLILPVALFLAIGEQPHRGTWRRRILWFMAGCMPGMATVAAMNQILYGSPAAFGYGSVGNFYHVAGAAGTAWQYLVWLWDTHSIYVFLPFLLPVVAVRPESIPRPLRWFCWSALAFFAANLACYVLYLRFDHWTYLRFLLPSIPLLMIAATALVTHALRDVSRASRAAVLSFVAAMFPFAYVHTAAKADAFNLKPGFRHRFEDAAALAVARLPPNAVFLAVGQTGSLRHYGRRLTLHFDWIEAAHADDLVAYLRRRGLATYAALDQSEVARFTARFAGTAMVRAVAAARPLSLPPDGAVVFFPLDAGRPAIEIQTRTGIRHDRVDAPSQDSR